MMTFLDITARNERDHEEALALREVQVRVLCAYRDELEDKADIGVEMIAAAFHCSKDRAAQIVEDAYEARKAARKAAVGT